MRTIALTLSLILLTTALPASDWPMWRCDAARTATAPEPLPENLHLQWVRGYPALRAAFWQVRQERVQFDLGYEPIVCGKTMFVPSSLNDSLTALDTETGEERWRFYAEGPIRLAAAAGLGKVYVASDDGRLYCLDAATGRARWSVRGAPSPRRMLGNGRLISAWPARGAPVLAGDTVYFAAGVWPFEGIFVTALDAASGRRRWVNDRTGLALHGPSTRRHVVRRPLAARLLVGTRRRTGGAQQPRIPGLVPSGVGRTGKLRFRFRRTRQRARRLVSGLRRPGTRVR